MKPTVARAAAQTRAKSTNRPQHLAGIDGRSADGRRRRDLIDGFVAALGGRDHVTSPVMADISRAADLIMLTERARGDSLRGDPASISVSDLIRLEGARDRAVRRLGLKPGDAVKPPNLHDYLNSKYGSAPAEADVADEPEATEG